MCDKRDRVFEHMVRAAMISQQEIRGSGLLAREAHEAGNIKVTEGEGPSVTKRLFTALGDFLNTQSIFRHSTTTDCGN